MSYDYLAFFSYKKSPQTNAWHRKFHEHLTFWLNQEMGDQFEIFFDVNDIEPGFEFDKVLKRELARSAVLVPVWSPLYFSSRWCRTELQAFTDREDSLGLDRGSLIVPVCFHKEEEKNFPDEAAKMQYMDFREYATPHPHLWEGPQAGPFIEEIKKLARVVKNKLIADEHPDYDDSFQQIEESTYKPKPSKWRRVSDTLGATA